MKLLQNEEGTFHSIFTLVSTTMDGDGLTLSPKYGEFYESFYGDK